MALDKLVDSTQLDSDLTSVANAIRTKGGTSASLAFPAGFVSAIGDIPSGGDASEYISVIEGTPQSILTLPGVTALRDHLFANVSSQYSIESDEILTVDSYCFENSSGLAGLSLPNCELIKSYALKGTRITSLFVPKAVLASNCTNSTAYLQTVVCKGTLTSGTINYVFKSNTALTAVDMLGAAKLDNTFTGCSSLSTLVLRSTSLIPMSYQAFSQTPFDSGGTGGTIYIPKSLYDHLGDNTSSDYKAATNWSTIDGYGTITWAKIEGSYYETHYADGTEIPTN